MRPSALTTPAVTVRVEAERVADRDRELADPQRVRVAERERRQAGRACDLQHREVGVRVVADQVGRQLRAVGERRRAPRRAPWTTWLLVSR